MKEVLDNTLREGGLPTLPGLYLSTFQPSQRGFFRVQYIRLFEGRRAWARIFKLIRTPGISSTEFVQKFDSFIAWTPTIVDSYWVPTQFQESIFPPLTSLLKLSLCAGNFKPSLGAKNRVGIGLSYRPARLHMRAKLIPLNRFLHLKVFCWSCEEGPLK